jgi:hypothetical protein
MTARVVSDGSKASIGADFADGVNWSQDIVFNLDPRYEGLPIERLIEEIETATGIRSDAPMEEEIEPIVERLREARDVRDD